MRTLNEEIIYCRKYGYRYNHIDVNVMLAWLGEQVLLEQEISRLKAQLNSFTHYGTLYEFDTTYGKHVELTPGKWNGLNSTRTLQVYTKNE